VWRRGGRMHVACEGSWRRGRKSLRLPAATATPWTTCPLPGWFVLPHLMDIRDIIAVIDTCIVDDDMQLERRCKKLIWRCVAINLEPSDNIAAPWRICEPAQQSSELQSCRAARHTGKQTRVVACVENREFAGCDKHTEDRCCSHESMSLFR
jgi:hypothetical protein